jgi:hypothetical protein
MADPNDPTRTLINSNSGLNYTPLSIPSNLLPSLACSGLGGNDTLTVDERNGACIPAGGITFNGDTGLDTVNYFGSQSGDAITANATTLVAHGRTITPQGIDTLNIDGAGGNDSVLVAGVSSTLGNLTLAGGDGDDLFTLASASFNTSITINGGNGNDVATMGSSTSSLSAGSLHFNGEAGDDAMFDYGSTSCRRSFDGGTGDDTATYYSLGGAVTVSDYQRQPTHGGFQFFPTPSTLW